MVVATQNIREDEDNRKMKARFYLHFGLKKVFLFELDKAH